MEFLQRHIRSRFAQSFERVEYVTFDFADCFEAAVGSHFCPVALLVLVRLGIVFVSTFCNGVSLAKMGG